MLVIDVKSIGIICEYNPFHNGHIYQINKIKEMFPDSIIIAVMSGNFTQRGIPSILTKDEKASICINNNIDLVIELPFVFASQSADIFASGAIQILKALKVEYLVFGSEANDIETLTNIADIQINSSEYDKEVKKYLDLGYNYPTAMNKALKINFDFQNSPNDLLGLSYIKAIKLEKASITPISIKRTNDFHSIDLNNKIVSATAIRNALMENKNIEDYVPKEVYNILKNKNNKEYFKYLKYKIISEGTSINKYQTVDEGIENRILKAIDKSNSLDELINAVKTKRYTYNKLCRMFIHILCSLTKEEAQNNKSINYIRVLEFNKNGQHYLSKIKKELQIPLITTTKYYNDLLTIENRVDNIYKLL